LENIDEIKLHLRKIGFTENESKVFLALLNGTQMSASEVAKAAGIRRTDIYDILKVFVDRGYCNEIETNTILKYEIIDPRVISGKIVNDIETESTQKISDAKELVKQVLPYYNTGLDSVNRTNIELVRGFNKHRMIRFMELIKNSREEILMMNRIEGEVSKQADAISQEFINNGGVYKSIYEVSLNFKLKKDDKWGGVTLNEFLELCKFYEENGEQIRLTKMLTVIIGIFDREIVYLNVHDKSIPKHNKTDIIIRNKEFAQFFVNIFDLSWNQSFTIDEFKEMSFIKSNSA
jgi:sugar-specific transcriptional regulator TrmB